MIPLSAWQSLDSPPGHRLLERCRTLDLRHPACLEALRREHDPQAVLAAVELTLARQAAFDKFGDQAASLWADQAGVEMASSRLAAAHKARRLAALKTTYPIFDLCCGIGADAIALTQSGLDAIGVDQHEVRAWMCARNAGCRTRAEDVRILPPGQVRVFHIDPQRRSGGNRRTPRLDDLQPGIDFLSTLALSAEAGCIKLFPGVPFDVLPRGEVEILSERGRLRQALLWTGTLASRQHARSATVLDAGATLSGQPGPAPMGPVGAYVHTVDPAVERAELIGELAELTRTTTPHPASGLLTGGDPIDSPFLRTFRLLDQMPWSLSAVRRRLRELEAGVVTIKTRGRAVEPDKFAAQLRGCGSRPLVLFVQRFGSRFVCLICEPHDPH
ncbi:MAG: hypothetical protein KJZ65_10335 [Phycisphaerales bacterium]|nr:hypothetical protein [Phycisphaerales bacterium]